MKRENRTERSEGLFLPATASSKGLGDLPIGSIESRAAARSLLAAREKSESEEDWDKELDSFAIAERLSAARKRSQEDEELEETLEQWTPIYIPPGKEDTLRGRMAMRMNAAKLRVALLAKCGDGWSQSPEWMAHRSD
jgi:hypothetical protein